MNGEFEIQFSVSVRAYDDDVVTLKRVEGTGRAILPLVPTLGMEIGERPPWSQYAFSQQTMIVKHVRWMTICGFSVSLGQFDAGDRHFGRQRASISEITKTIEECTKELGINWTWA